MKRKLPLKLRKRKASLEGLRTKKAEKAARASQKKPVVDMTPSTEAIPSKQKGISLHEAQAEADRHSDQQFPDPREGELWDQLGITEALWEKCVAEEPEVVDLGEVYISSSIEAMISTMISQLKDLHSRDKSEVTKIHNYQKRAETEPDEEFKQHALKLLQQVTDVNTTTKDNIKIFRGKIKVAVKKW